VNASCSITLGRPVGPGAGTFALDRRYLGAGAAPGAGHGDGPAEQDGDRPGHGGERSHDPGGGAAANGRAMVSRPFRPRAMTVAFDIMGEPARRGSVPTGLGPACSLPFLFSAWVTAG